MSEVPSLEETPRTRLEWVPKTALHGGVDSSSAFGFGFAAQKAVVKNGKAVAVIMSVERFNELTADRFRHELERIQS